MHTIALIAIALLSLIAGSFFESPAAKAQTSSRKVAAQHVQSGSEKADEQGQFRIVNDEASPETSRRHVAVLLTRRIAEAEIVRIADGVRAKEKAPFERTVVSFYLPGMKIGEGAWAMAVFNPTLKVSVIGLRLDEEQTATAEVAADKRQLVGAWLTAPPAAPGRLTFYRDGTKTLAEWRLRDGTKSTEELVESSDQRGRRFAPRDGGTDFYLITWSGDLEIRDAHSVIATAGKLHLPGDPAAAAPVRPTAVAAAKPRRNPAVSAAQSSDAVSKALSDKLFKF